MHWIEHITRAPHGPYQLVGRNLAGASEVFEVSDFPHLCGVATKSRVTVTSTRHETTPVDDYLKHMGWEGFNGVNQRLHRFYTDSLEIWLPSQALFKMLLDRFSPLYDTAFCGRSLHELVVPSRTEDPLAMQPGWRRRNTTNLYASRETGETGLLMHRLFWLLHSRSAARSLGHVRRNATQGVLDIPLPRGTFDVFVTGKRIGDIVLATRMRISKVTCDDLLLQDGTPLENMELDFATRDLSYMEKRGMSAEPADQVDKWLLNDMQFRDLLDWMLNAGVIQGRENYTQAHERVLKRHLELLRARFIGRLLWKALPCDAQELACVQARMYKLRKAGLWDEVSARLLAV